MSRTPAVALRAGRPDGWMQPGPVAGEPGAAEEPVVAVAAGQGVGERRAQDHRLEAAPEARQSAGIGQGAALGMAAGDRPGGPVTICFFMVPVSGFEPPTY